MNRNEFEVGDEAIEVKRRQRAGVVVSARLSAEEADQLQRIADERRTTLSRVAREAIATYLRTGAGGQPAGSPWTGTIGGYGVRFELFMSHSWPVVRTSGDVQELDTAHR